VLTSTKKLYVVSGSIKNYEKPYIVLNYKITLMAISRNGNHKLRMLCPPFVNRRWCVHRVFLYPHF